MYIQHLNNKDPISKKACPPPRSLLPPMATTTQMAPKLNPYLRGSYGLRLSVHEHAINVIEISSDSEKLKNYCEMLDCYGLRDRVLDEAMWVNYTGF